VKKQHREIFYLIAW